MGRARQAAELPEFVGTREMSQVLNISEPHVRSLAEKGILTQKSGGLWPLVQNVHAFLSWHRDRGTRKALEDQKVRKLQLENAKAEGRIITLDNATDLFVAGAQAFVSGLDALPGRLASEFAGIGDAAIIRSRLREEFASIKRSVDDIYSTVTARARVPAASAEGRARGSEAEATAGPSPVG